MRTKPVPQAFRAFFRQIGLDPDVRRIPSEEAAVSRLLHGGFRTVDLISDACLVALIETGVPVWALDADGVDAGGLGIRTARPDVRLGRRPAATMRAAPAPGAWSSPTAARCTPSCSPSRLPGHGVGARTRRVMLFAVAVDGVPDIHLDEALWCALNVLGAAP